MLEDRLGAGQAQLFHYFIEVGEYGLALEEIAGALAQDKTAITDGERHRHRANRRRPGRQAARAPPGQRQVRRPEGQPTAWMCQAGSGDLTSRAAVSCLCSSTRQ
jgi:hypothetical protein